MLWMTVSNAQAPFMKHNFSYLPAEKYAPNAISTLDGRQINTSADRAIFYSENFDEGFGGWVSAIQTGPVGFKLTSTGHLNDSTNMFYIPALETNTPTQWVVLDSDEDNNSYAVAEATTLTSPELDLSAAAGTYVALKFDQFFAEWQSGETSDHCYIAISTDSIFWTEIEINEGVGREARPNPENVSWDITDIIAGSESSVWIRFRWQGAWNYGWQIDNVRIENIHESDLTIMDSYRMYDDGIVYSKLAQAHTQEFVIGAIIKNNGHIEQTNIGFNWTIIDSTGSVAATGMSSTIDSLLNGQQDTVIFATGFTPVMVGNYTIEWTAFADEADDEMADNFASDNYFELTEYVMALDYTGGPVIETSNWPLKNGLAYFGNLMSFQGDDVATALLVKLANHSANAGEIIGAAVWELPQDEETWNLVYYTDDYEIKPSDIGNFVAFDLEEFHVNSTSTYVFCSFLYANGAYPVFERQGDIGFNNIQGFDDVFLSRGFFDRSAPIVRVRLYEGEVSVDEEEIPIYFTVYPNPTKDDLTIRFSTKSASTTNINVIDITGKVLKVIQLGETNGETQIKIELDELTTGVYFVELSTDHGTQIKKFVKK